MAAHLVGAGVIAGSNPGDSALEHATTARLSGAPGAEWDVIVIGAGPAGSLAAHILARQGLSVLLVERARFPRPKVCGGCLNARALAILACAGLGGRVRQTGATTIKALRLRHRGRTAVIGLPEGLAVSRATLDAELAAAAVEAGCVLMTETSALVVPEGDRPWREGWRRVSLQQRHGRGALASARAVVVADGLAHTALRECTSFRTVVAPAARIGIGAEAGPGAIETEAASITMAVGRCGYVGAVEVEGKRVNVAAALDPGFLKTQGTAPSAVRAILAEAGVRAGPALEGIQWMGTVSLTRRLTGPAARGVFVIGDAAGYVEPFTGEGMAWAFAAAEAVAPFVQRAAASHDPAIEGDWVRAYADGIGREQRWCRLIARALRHPALVAPAVMLLRKYPGLAGPIVAQLVPHQLA